MTTTHQIEFNRTLNAPVEPAALVAFRLAPDQLIGSVDVHVDTSLDYRDLGPSGDEIRPVILNILPTWLRDLADRIEAEGRHLEHLSRCMFCDAPTTSTVRGRDGGSNREGILCEECQYNCDGNIIGGAEDDLARR